MNQIVAIAIRFVLFAFIQVIVLNNLELGWGAYAMLYPLFIIMLPFEWGTIPLMVVSFFYGLSIDAFSNTFGLHASAAVLMAYCRPAIFKVYAPRDGYENLDNMSVSSLGFNWLLSNYGTLLLIHHTWFFLLESFQLNELLLILRKVALSVPFSFLISILVQFIFMRKKGG